MSIVLTTMVQDKNVSMSVNGERTMETVTNVYNAERGIT